MALVQENSRPPRHRPPRVDLRHVIDMTLVDGDPGSAGTATTSEEENNGVHGAAPEDHGQRQVFPEDVLHALATLETFRHLAAAGIDDELGLEAGTIRQLARLDAPTTRDMKSDNDKHSDNTTGVHRNRRDSVAVSEIEVNLDGKVPARAKFNSHETMFDIKIEPLADFIESLTDPDHLDKVKEILDKASTPFDYYRIDEHINESFRPQSQNAATSWLAANHGHRSRVPNVPIIRELRIDITTLHPSAIYRLEQFRRRQLKERTLPIKLDIFVEEKEPEWIKQRTREKKLARKLEREKERIQQMLQEEKERELRAKELEREQAAMVRRHLGLSFTSRRGRRHSGDSNGSSEMTSVPSDVSSPSPPPRQIFHEVQESVPFPFAPSSPVPPTSIPAPLQDPLPSSSLQPSEVVSEQSPQQNGETGASSSSATAIDATNTVKKLLRLKLKFKGLTVGTPSPTIQVTSPARTPNVDGNKAAGTPVPGSVASADGSTSIERQQSDVIASTRPPQQGSSLNADDILTLSPKSIPIPSVATEVINRMQTLLSDQNKAAVSSQETANVGITVDVTIAKAGDSTSDHLTDEGRHSISISTISPRIDDQVSQSKMGSSAASYSCQDEEDEAIVEVLGGLDAVSGSGSSGGFRRNVDALSSAGSLQRGKSPGRFPDLAAAEREEFTGNSRQLQTVASTAQSTSDARTIPDAKTVEEHQQHGPESAFDFSSMEEPQSGAIQADFQMLIDDELEPVSFEDTQAGTWKAIYKGGHGVTVNKGKERTSSHKGKERANELSLQIRSVNSSDTEDNSQWAQSARVIQVKGITGPTATDTESASIQSPDTRSVSPAPMIQSPDAQIVEMPRDLTSDTTSAAARLSLERRRQNEALYAALASSFLNRCAPPSQSHAVQLLGIQAGLMPQSLWLSPGTSSRRTSSTPPESYVLQQRAGITTCDPRDVFGNAAPVEQVKSEVEGGGTSTGEPADREESHNEHQNAPAEPPTDDEIEMAEVSPKELIISSPEREEETAIDFTQQESRSSSVVEDPARSSASRPTASAGEDSPAYVTEDSSAYVTEDSPEIEVLGTSWHRSGRASRNKRKNFTDMIPIDELELSPPKRQRTLGNARRSPAYADHVLNLNTDDDDDEPVYISGRNPWTDPTNVEVVIPIRRQPFSPPKPRAGPNLKIRLNLGPYRQ